MKVKTLWSSGWPAECFSELWANTAVVPEDLDKWKPSQGDALVLWGGADICPRYYHQRPTSHAHAYVPSPRDIREYDEANAAIERGIPIIGICRGAQWLAILAGGSLIQHVEGHIGDHPLIVKTREEKSYTTNSIHHQMMRVKHIPHELIAWTPKRSQVYEVDLLNATTVYPEEFENDPEIIFFPSIHGLGFQYHPEMMDTRDPTYVLSQELIQSFIKE